VRARSPRVHQSDQHAHAHVSRCTGERTASTSRAACAQPSGLRSQPPGRYPAAEGTGGVTAGRRPAPALVTQAPEMDRGHRPGGTPMPSRAPEGGARAWAMARRVACRRVLGVIRQPAGMQRVSRGRMPGMAGTRVIIMRRSPAPHGQQAGAARSNASGVQSPHVLRQGNRSAAVRHRQTDGEQ
jgi:hypothetical protein